MPPSTWACCRRWPIWGCSDGFDYLSTVSGGGYIGSWLAAWIKREGSIHTVEKQLQDTRVGQAAGRLDDAGSWPQPRQTPTEEEPAPLFNLRRYSNYLAPLASFISIDTWVLAATYLRNLLLNLLNIIPLVLCAMLLPRVVECGWVELGMPAWVNGRTTSGVQPWVLFVAGNVFLLIGILAILWNFWQAGRAAEGRRSYALGSSAFDWLAAFPLLLAAVMFCWFAGKFPISTKPLPGVSALSLTEVWGRRGPCWATSGLAWARALRRRPFWARW